MGEPKSQTANLVTHLVHIYLKSSSSVTVTCGQPSVLLYFLFTQDIFQITENLLKQLNATSHVQNQEPDQNPEWCLGGFIMNFHRLFYSCLLLIN